MYLSHALLAALAAVASSAADAPPAGAYDEALLREVAAVAPAAVDEARAAGEAYRAQRWQESIDRYARVLAAAPAFSHALRRQCNAHLALGERDAAIPLCRRALQLAALPENEGALARALAFRDGPRAPTLGDEREASRLAGAVISSRAADRDSVLVACEVGMRLGDRGVLRVCSDALERSAPDDAATHYYAAIVALTREGYREARQHVARARAAGLPGAEADRLGRWIDEAQPAYLRYGPPALVAALAWAAGLALLLGVGWALSRMTLRRAALLASAPAEARAAAPALLRRAYALVLGLCCAYYYVSIPLVLLGVVAAGGGTIYLFLSVGRVPVKLVLVVALVVLVTVWAVLKAVWASVFRAPDADPGPRMARGANPRLDAVLAGVAQRIGTRPVDAVFLTPGTNVAVFERGSVAKQLSGRSERCLILGVGVLDGMTQGELKAVLAHEYGHLVNRDTAGGGLALAVRRSVWEMAVTLARGGAATWYSPAWWFVNGFHRTFLRVSQGASRLQEILADRWAALAYGGQNFGRGLRHVIERSIRFDRHAEASLKEIVDGHAALANLYRYAPRAAADEAALEAALEQALSAEPSPYDSHPRPSDRIAWVAGVSASSTDEGDDAAAWDLFSDRVAVERLMTDEVRASVARSHGIEIPAEAAPGAISAAP